MSNDLIIAIQHRLGEGYVTVRSAEQDIQELLLLVAERDAELARDCDPRQEDAEEECGMPCSPVSPCEECESHWIRMREEGFWVDGQGWSDKAMKEMTE